MAFGVVKAMQAEGLDWDEGYRPMGRQPLEAIIEAQMATAVERLLVLRAVQCRLQILGQVRDLLGGFARRGGERLHLLGDHREAARVKRNS
jgi:hypothetical protein